MAMTTGQVCGERWKYTDYCYYVYQPTGVGDWYRWRMVAKAQVNTLGDTIDGTYFCLAGCARGQVYAGAQKIPTDSDANSGFAATAVRRGATCYYATSIDSYREFNVPEGMTHCRLISYAASDLGDLRLTAYAGETVLEATDYDGYPDLVCIYETDWYTLPAGTTKIRVHKAVDDSKATYLIGLDWINKNSVADPDAAGSIMWSGTDVPGSEVLPPAHWGATSLFAIVSSWELALYWSDRGEAFNAVNCCGGLSHAGIDTAVIAWASQAADGALTAWVADKGDKVAGDYFRMGITSAVCYQEAALTNARGALTGSLLWDSSGLQVQHTVTASADMDIFDLFNVMCLVPADVSKCYFQGEESVRALTRASVLSAIKSPKIEIWGGAAATHITVEHQQADTALGYYAKVDANAYPRLTWRTSPDYYKFYMNYRADQTTPEALDSGSSVSTRFAIRLRDRRFAQKRVVRLL
jgi:hypothetical protein